MTDEETSDFIISRLAKLVVVLLNEHVGSSTDAMRARIDARMILEALALLAARNGRPGLMPVLQEMARLIHDPPPAQEPEPPLYEIPKVKRRIKYGWQTEE